jgi:Domain of unknown function (DUF4276)
MPCKICRPAFLVEGDLEQAFIQNVCVGAPVRKIGCNGDSVSIEAIAKRVGTLGRLLQKNYDPIVVVFDRERRSETSEQLERALLEAVSAEGLSGTVIVGVPDRDIEVWMVADREVFRQNANLSDGCDISLCEGYKGKAFIKQLLKEVSRPYVETIDGPVWLKKARTNHIAAHSPSFARLADCLKDIGCWWLKDQSLI